MGVAEAQVDDYLLLIFSVSRVESFDLTVSGKLSCWVFLLC